MNPFEKKENRVDKHRKINYWKWAFITLLTLLIIALFLLVRALQPVEIESSNENTEEVSVNPVQLSASLNTEDTERLINNYLEVYNQENDETYHLRLTNDLEIIGTLDFMSLEVPFILHFTPYVLENGNVQLRGQAVEIGNFQVPMQLVLRLFGNQAVLPHFIALDSESQVIIINFKELTSEYNFEIQMTRIDLDEDVIEFNLLLDEHTIFEQIF